MGTWQGRLGVVEFATAGAEHDTGRIVAARVAILDDDGTELARWDWGSDRGDRIVGEVAQTLRTLLALSIPLAIFDAADGLTVLDRECRRRGLDPLDDPAPVLDPLLLDHLIEPEFEGSRALNAMAERYDVEPGSLAAGRLVLAMAQRDEFSGTPTALHARQRSMIDDWPVVPLDDVRTIVDTQPIPPPPLRPSDTVPMLDFSGGVLQLEAPGGRVLTLEELEPEPAEAEPDVEHEPAAAEPEHEPVDEAEPVDEPQADEPQVDDEPDSDAIPELVPPPTRIHVAAAIVTDPAGRAVVVRKRGTTGYMQPGGKIERGESALACLIRELDEELGLAVDVDATEFLGSFEAAALNEPGATVRAEVFALTTDDELHPAGEIDDVYWLESPDDTESVELAPLTLDVLLPLWASRRPALH